MKYLKLFESFQNEKWILSVNENFFDKIEDLVKGKSEKGKIVEEFLKKNNIQQKGSAYGVHFLGGSQPGKEEKSHAFDYLHYTPNVAKIENGVLVLTDEKSKQMKVPDTLSFLAVIEKESIAKNWTFGLKQGCSVLKYDYTFNLSEEKPTMTQTKFMYSIPEQKWNKVGELETIELDEDIKEFTEEDFISFKTPMNLITLQEWVDKLNETGWVKKDTKYFLDYIQGQEEK